MKTKISVLMILLLLAAVTAGYADPVLEQIFYAKTSTSALPASSILKFSLWDTVTGGSEVWSEQKTISLTGNKTKIITYLGDTTPFTDVDFSQQLYVQVERYNVKKNTYKVIGTRDRLSMVPYALWSARKPFVVQQLHGSELRSYRI